MDLGYNSSSDEEIDNSIGINKEITPLVKKPDIETLKLKLIGIQTEKRELEESEIDDVFKLKEKRPRKSVEKEKDLFDQFKEVVKRTNIVELDNEHLNTDKHLDDDNVTEFDMEKFYKSNEDAIQSGELNPNTRHKKMVFHGSIKHGSGLSDVMKWNISNEGKIQHQNEIQKQKIKEMKMKNNNNNN